MFEIIQSQVTLYIFNTLLKFIISVDDCEGLLQEESSNMHLDLGALANSIQI